MDNQMTFSDIEYGGRKKTTRKTNFLRIMDAVIPWRALVAVVEPHYYDGKFGRPPIGIETMLRMYFLQVWFNLSDELTEDSIYDVRPMHEFMRINFMSEQAPDATTLASFRKLLETHNLQERLLASVNALLTEQGLVMRGGTIVDATIIQAPSSTRNSTGERDPEMHSTKKAGQNFFGMKSHIGVDMGSGIVVSTSHTAANAHDVTAAHNLYREDDEVRGGDSGYLGVEKRAEVLEMDGGKTVEYKTVKRPSQRKEKHEYPINWERYIEMRKASVRAKVEYVFYIVKRIFGVDFAIYRGIDKNAARLNMAYGLANIYMYRHRLLSSMPPP
jgi:IS5 family transposase